MLRKWNAALLPTDTLSCAFVLIPKHSRTGVPPEARNRVVRGEKSSSLRRSTRNSANKSDGCRSVEKDHASTSRLVDAVFRRSRHRTRPWSISASGTAKVGTITNGLDEMRRFGASMAKRCARPGEAVSPVSCWPLVDILRNERKLPHRSPTGEDGPAASRWAG